MHMRLLFGCALNVFLQDKTEKNNIRANSQGAASVSVAMETTRMAGNVAAQKITYYACPLRLQMAGSNLGSY